MPGRLRTVHDQRQGQQRHRRCQAKPREQVEHRHIPRPPQQEIADRESDRTDHQHREGADAEIVADGAADHQQADRCDADSDGLHARRHLAERDHGERDREQRLALHDHAGKPHRHAMRDAESLRQELAEEQRGADGDQQWPRHIRLAHEQARHRRDGKAQRRHQRRRQFVERQPARHEAQAPRSRRRGSRERCRRVSFVQSRIVGQTPAWSRYQCRERRKHDVDVIIMSLAETRFER